MVKIKNVSVPNELVGIEDPTPFISALFSYTAKADKERARMEVQKGHEVVQPYTPFYEKIKALSLFPSIYTHAK